MKTYHIVAMHNDFHLANQPFWDIHVSSLKIARVLARHTWEWIVDEGAPDSGGKRQVENIDDVCIFVFDDQDELGEHPYFVIGNPSASEN